MKASTRAQFNVTAAANWFKTVEGLPYGYHNFLFGWLDDVDNNLPPVLSIELAYVLFAYLERIWAYPMDELVG